MRKKLLPILLAISIATSCLCLPAFAADEFAEREGWNGGTVKLEHDITTSRRIFVRGDVTLDLNGHTLTSTSEDSSFLIWGGATLTVTGDGEIRQENPGDISLFIVTNIRMEGTDNVFDEEGNLLSAGTREEVPDTGRLILEGGSFYNDSGVVLCVMDGSEAALGAVTLSGSGNPPTVYNRGEITAIGPGCTISSAKDVALVNEGTVDAITDATLSGGSMALYNVNRMGDLTGCTLSSPGTTLTNTGKLGIVSDCHIITQGFTTIDNSGYIEALSTGTKIDGGSMSIQNWSEKAYIGTISVDYIKAGNEAITNHGIIDTIAAGDFTADYHCMENLGTIHTITGGSFTGRKYFGINNHSTIGAITGGTFTGGAAGLLNGYEQTNKGKVPATIERVSGGVFRGVDANGTIEGTADGNYNGGLENASGATIGTMAGYTATADKGYGISNNEESTIGDLGAGTLEGTLGKVRNAGVIGAMFDWDAVVGTQTAGAVEEKPQTTVPPVNVEFSDMGNSWAKDYVTELAEQEIINGYPDGSFGPGNNVTRGEIAKLVSTAEGVPTKGGEPAFVDTKGTWSVKFVNGLADRDIIRAEDYPDGYQEGAQATRIEVLTMLMRSMGYNKPVGGGPVKLTFPDAADLTAEQAYYVDCAVRRGVLTGASDGNLNPDKPITRAEVAAMLSRMLKAQK